MQMINALVLVTLAAVCTNARNIPNRQHAPQQFHDEQLRRLEQQQGRRDSIATLSGRYGSSMSDWDERPSYRPYGGKSYGSSESDSAYGRSFADDRYYKSSRDSDYKSDYGRGSSPDNYGYKSRSDRYEDKYVDRYEDDYKPYPNRDREYESGGNRGGYYNGPRGGDNGNGNGGPRGGDNGNGGSGEAPRKKSRMLRVMPLRIEPLYVEPLRVMPLQVQPLQVQPLEVQPLEVQPLAVEPLAVEPLQVEALEVESLGIEPVEFEELDRIHFGNREREVHDFNNNQGSYKKDWQPSGWTPGSGSEEGYDSNPYQ